MTPRERVLKAIARQEPDRVPAYLWLTPHLVDRLRNERGVEDHESYLRMDIRMANYHAVPEEIDFSPYTAHYPPNTTVNPWGSGAFEVGYYHFTKAVHPIEHFSMVAEVEAYPFPKREPIVEEIRKEVDAIKAEGLAACSAYEEGTFETAHGLMGMENHLANLHLNPDMMRLLYDRISDTKARIAAAYVEAGVDILWIGDDIGIQRGPTIHPAMWREFLIPPLRKIVAAARSVRPDIPIAYHSCGQVGFAVEGLIEAGVNILQSVQPEANNPAELKALYGDRIAFWGGVGSQSTMSHGTPEDVRAEIRHLIETVGTGGGYICSPAHAIEPEVPLENIDAFVEAVEKYGNY